MLSRRAEERGRVECHRHAEIFGRVPQRFEVRIVYVAAVGRIGVGDERDGAERLHCATRLRHREIDIVVGQLRRELEALRSMLAELESPLVVRSRERRRIARLQRVVHQHLSPAGAEQDADVNPLDVHRLEMALRIVTPRSRTFEMRVAREGRRLQSRLRPDRFLLHARNPDCEVPENNARLLRWASVASLEARQTIAERVFQVSLPQVVRLHRVQIAIHDLEAVLHRARAFACGFSKK